MRRFLVVYYKNICYTLFGVTMKKNTKLIGKIKYFIEKNSKDNISAIAGQSAFFMILSIVPLLMFAFAVLSFFNIPRDVFETYLQGSISSEFSVYFQGFIDTAYENSVGIAFTTLILALWSAGKGIYSITEGINRIYKIPNRNFWFVKRLYAMGYTLIMLIVIFLALGILVIGEFVDEIIKPYIKNLPHVIELMYTLRYVVAFVAIVLLMSLALTLYLHRKLDDKRWAKFRLQLPGVLITALCWILLSIGIGVYVKYFNGFSIYGSLGTLAVVMIWIYFSMYIMLYCIQLNYINRYLFYDLKSRCTYRIKTLLNHIDKRG